MRLPRRMRPESKGTAGDCEDAGEQCALEADDDHRHGKRSLEEQRHAARGVGGGHRGDVRG